VAVAEIIGAAVGVLLLVVVAYLLVGGTLTAAETVANAQKDLTLLNEARLRTDWRINADEIAIEGNGLNFSVTNTGNEIITDFRHIDVFTYDNSNTDYEHYTFDNDRTGSAGKWAVIRINDNYNPPNQLYPGEKAWIMATFSSNDPVWVMITTNNGVYTQLAAPITGWR
jgi:flagellar protein FlaF